MEATFVLLVGVACGPRDLCEQLVDPYATRDRSLVVMSDRGTRGHARYHEVEPPPASTRGAPPSP